MKLYGSYTSPFVRHVRIVLLETGFECEFVETDQAASASSSPTKRVPFFKDGNIFLSDSSSIIKYLREKAGQDFCKSAQAFDEYCLVNTALDATVNLFFIKRDGVDINTIPYLQRQAARIESTLDELERCNLPMTAPYTDAQLRLACYIGWCKLRKQVDFSSHPKLEAFYTAALAYPHFSATRPPEN